MATLVAPLRPPEFGWEPCPLCGTSRCDGERRCSGCRADLGDPAAARLVELDARWRDLLAERAALVAELEATRAPLPPPTGSPIALPPPTGSPIALPPPTGSPIALPPPAVPHGLGVATMLGIAGAALLTAAAVVFAAVTWATLPALLQATILIGATGLVTVAARVLDRRSMPTAAASLGLVAVTFVAVDVIALDRSDAVGFGPFAGPVALAAAAAIAWVLSRTGLRWVATAGASAAVAAAAATPLTATEAYGLGPHVAAFVATAAAVTVAVTTPVWQVEVARRIAALGGAVIVTVAGLVAAGGLAAGTAEPLVGSAAVGLPIVVTLVAARWTDLTLAPASLLLTAGTAGLAVALGAEPIVITTVVAVVVTLLAWGAAVTRPSRRAAILAGGLPATTGVGLTILLAATSLGERFVTILEGGSETLLDPWVAALALAAGAAVMAAPIVRAHAEWPTLAVLVLAAGTVPAAVAWPTLLLVAVVVATPQIAVRVDPLVARADPVAVLVTLAAATLFAAGDLRSTAAAAAVAAAVAFRLALRAADVHRGRLAFGATLVAAGLAVAAGVAAAEVARDVPLAAATVVVFAGAASLPRWTGRTSAAAGPIVAGAVTFLILAIGTTERATGSLLLLAATGWLVLALTGYQPARWIAAAVASLGTAVLLADAGVDVVEAYTLVPAGTLSAVGILWLVQDRDIRTQVALAPALVVGLAPSLVVLSGDPRVLARTLGLTVAAGCLAFGGVRGRWLAPVVAGAVTAVWVALTQLSIAVELAPRWITFATVGIVLVWLAATYERQERRARRVARQLTAFR